MSGAERAQEVRVACTYLAIQAVAGALWWVAVFASDDVRVWTLGEWDPALLVAPDLVLFVGASAVTAATRHRLVGVVTVVWTVGVTVALALHGLSAETAGWGVALMTLASVGTVAAVGTIWLGHLPTAWFFVGPFSFRVADPRPGWQHLLRSLTQLVLFWSTFFIVVPVVLAAAERRLALDWSALDGRLADIAGTCLFLLGSALGLWSCTTMALRGEGTPLPSDTARQLVASGPYGLVRNPMAVAGVGQTAGIGLLVGSWSVMVVALVGAGVWHVLIRPTEEADLAARFGEPYRAYAARVRCWIPTRPNHDAATGGATSTAR